MMTTLLHIDSSARRGISGRDAHGSHTRRLGARFVEGWLKHQPDTRVVYRDVGQNPPAPVSGAWIEAAFTPEAARSTAMREALAESDELVGELLAADVVVIGVPMYNFGPPAQLKAYIDNIVRVGLTFGFDRKREGVPYWPMLADMGKRLVLLSARGDFGYDDVRLARNHVEPAVQTAFDYVGISECYKVAVEYDEFGGESLAQSLLAAEAEVGRLVAQMNR